jgi:nitrogen fixation NifU-like protein
MASIELEELYREILLDHYRSPRNRGALDGAASCAADGANPLCGDEVHLEVQLEDGRIADIRFAGSGCSISQASSSLMTEYVKGRTIEDALRGVAAFQEMMVRGAAPSDVDFGDIESLIGVAKFPARVKCASLSWKTLEQALRNPGGREPAAAVTTDERMTSDA